MCIVYVGLPYVSSPEPRWYFGCRVIKVGLSLVGRSSTLRMDPNIFKFLGIHRYSTAAREQMLSRHCAKTVTHDYPLPFNTWKNDGLHTDRPLAMTAHRPNTSNAVVLFQSLKGYQLTDIPSFIRVIPRANYA